MFPPCFLLEDSLSYSLVFCTFNVNSAFSLLSFSFFFFWDFVCDCILFINQRKKLHLFKVLIICCMNKVYLSIYLSFFLVVLYSFLYYNKLFNIFGDTANSILLKYAFLNYFLQICKNNTFLINSTQLPLLVMYLFTYLLLIFSCSH